MATLGSGGQTRGGGGTPRLGSVLVFSTENEWALPGQKSVLSASAAAIIGGLIRSRRAAEPGAPTCCCCHLQPVELWITGSRDHGITGSQVGWLVRWQTVCCVMVPQADKWEQVGAPDHPLTDVLVTRKMRMMVMMIVAPPPSKLTWLAFLPLARSSSFSCYRWLTLALLYILWLVCFQILLGLNLIWPQRAHSYAPPGFPSCGPVEQTVVILH